MTKESRLIGIAGDSGAGKDTVADIIIDELGGGIRMGLADPLKAFCEIMFDWSVEYTHGPSEMREKADPKGRRQVDGEPLTIRHGLRTLGVDWGRSCYPDIWIDFFRQRYRTFREAGFCPDPLGIQKTYISPGEVVVVPDVRFANDAAGVIEEGGEIWRIVHPAPTGLTSPGQIDDDGYITVHVSKRQGESEVDPFVSKVITNDGTLEDLRCKIQMALAVEAP
jgi:hypothetical protein